MTEPLRVLQVFTILNRGGAETMVMNYYRHIDRSRVQFDFLVCRPERGAYEDEIEAMGGRIYRIPPLLHVQGHRAAVRRFFMKHPEYQIIHGHVGELGYFIYKEAQHAGVRCIIAHAHSSYCDRDWKLPLRYILKFLIRKQVTHTMACGEEAARWYFGSSQAKRCLIVRNAIEAKCYRYSQEKRAQVREHFGWDSHLIIGNVARFSKVKNHLFLLEIIEELRKQRPDVLLVLVGDTRGDAYESVKSEVEKLGLGPNVQFLGSRSDVPDLLQGMDVYCAPSLYEGLSVSMVEAQAAGLHVITSTGVPEEVRLMPNSVSFLSLNESVEHWVEHILAPYERKDTYAEICQSGFDIVENARRLQQFYLDQVKTKD